MFNLNPGLLLFQGSVDVHQTAAVGTQQKIGAGLLNIASLVEHHFTGNRRVLDSEGSPKSAALVLPFQLYQFHIFQLSQQQLHFIPETIFPFRVTGTVPGNLHWTPAIFQLHLEHMNQKFTQFKYSRRE